MQVLSRLSTYTAGIAVIVTLIIVEIGSYGEHFLDFNWFKVAALTCIAFYVALHDLGKTDRNIKELQNKLEKYIEQEE